MRKELTVAEENTTALIKGVFNPGVEIELTDQNESIQEVNKFIGIFVEA